VGHVGHLQELYRDARSTKHKIDFTVFAEEANKSRCLSCPSATTQRSMEVNLHAHLASALNKGQWSHHRLLDRLPPPTQSNKCNFVNRSTRETG